MSLELQNLTRRFGHSLALDGASLEVLPGEIVALLGPSGCGKTTTLRIIAGFETADAGSVSLAGRDLMRLPPHSRDIGLVFQDYALFPHMNVEDNIAYGLRRRGMAKAERSQRVDEMLGLVRLQGYAKRRPSQLSGGQQQRVALARALAIAPRLLLLDEPLSNLDAKLRETLQSELRQILSTVATTTLIVTHDQEEAMALADRIAIMKNGRVLQIGAPREVYDDPADRFVGEFLGQSLWLDGYIDGQTFVTSSGTRLPCIPPSRRAAAYGALIRPECLRLGPAAAAGANLPGRLVGRRFHRHAVLAELLIEERARVLLEVPHELALPENGADVAVSLTRPAIRPVPDDEQPG